MGFIIHVKFFPNGFTLVPTTTLKGDPFSPHITEKQALKESVSLSMRYHTHRQ